MSKDDQHAELRDRINRALAELVRGEGLTPARVQSIAPWLIDELGVRNAQEACDLIRNTLKTLDWSSEYKLPGAVSWGQQRHNNALLAAFGGEGQPKKAAERREQHARAYGVTQATISVREKKARAFLADTLARIAEARK